MNKLFTSIVIILLCVTLTVNFIRVTVSGQFFEYDPTTVKTISYYAIVQDFSEISLDTDLLFRNMTKISTTVMEALKVVYDQLTTFSISDNGGALNVIKNILMAPVNTLKAIGTTFAAVVVGIFDIGQFVIAMVGDFINIFNHLLGFDLPDPDVVGDIGQGISGGGFGGRR